MYSVNDIITAIIGTAGAMSVISYFIAALYFDTNDEKQRLETELVELKRKTKWLGISQFLCRITICFLASHIRLRR